MNIIIQSTLKTLEKSKFLLETLSDNEFCDCSVPPYYSSIGSHIRHILDFYDCVLSMDFEKRIDLTARDRNKDVERYCILAAEYLNKIINQLTNVDYNFDEIVTVIDDLGTGKIEMSYTLAAVLSQANSHTIHHYAIINYILDGLEISMADSDFGYNPTTPKRAKLN
ncbi:DinB family protein [Yeosuana marina]|uniref:DinB family protein n=1 Tax=Yeosuana marina TaxID=1565536 RepID=UPI0030C7D800